MDEPERHSPYLKVPWPVVAGGLVVVLAVALGAGLYANANLRPATAVTFVTPAAATPASVSAPTLAAVAPPVNPTPTPEVVAQPTLNVTPVAPAAAAEPTAVPSATGTEPTIEPALAAEIGRAYERYWQVRAEALLELRTDRLHEVAEDEGLATLERGIQMLQSQQRAVRTKVRHRYRVISANDGTAEVADRYEDESEFVELVSLRPIPGAQPTSGNQTVPELYVLRNLEGTWKVVDVFSAS